MFLEDCGSDEGYNDAFIEYERDEVRGVSFKVMMHFEKRRVMMQVVETLRMLQGTKRKVMQMLNERVKVDEGLLSNMQMVISPQKFICQIYPMPFLGKMILFLSPLNNAHPTITN